MQYDSVLVAACCSYPIQQCYLSLYSQMWTFACIRTLLLMLCSSETLIVVPSRPCAGWYNHDGESILQHKTLLSVVSNILLSIDTTHSTHQLQEMNWRCCFLQSTGARGVVVSATWRHDLPYSKIRSGCTHGFTERHSLHPDYLSKAQVRKASIKAWISGKTHNLAAGRDIGFRESLLYDRS